MCGSTCLLDTCGNFPIHLWQITYSLRIFPYNLRVWENSYTLMGIFTSHTTYRKFPIHAYGKIPNIFYSVPPPASRAGQSAPLKQQPGGANSRTTKDSQFSLGCGLGIVKLAIGVDIEDS